MLKEQKRLQKVIAVFDSNCEECGACQDPRLKHAHGGFKIGRRRVNAGQLNLADTGDSDHRRVIQQR
jgi:hypothetical protein